jgi:hypothetical protein
LSPKQAESPIGDPPTRRERTVELASLFLREIVDSLELPVIGIERFVASWSGTHPDAQAGLDLLAAMVSDRTVTWREAWPTA